METSILSSFGVNIFRWSTRLRYSSQQLTKVSTVNPLSFNDVDEVPTFTKPAFNFAAYVQKSESLQNLLKLGVNLHQLEKRKGVPDFLLKLDFERDMKPHIRFLHDLDVPSERLGKFLTINPLIFKEEISTLALRVYYLQSKNFSGTQISRVITNNPFWLMFSTKRIDRRGGFFQEQFNLKGDDFRFLASKQPTLITYNLNHIRQNTFSIKEEMGFDDDEMRCLILNKPKIWMMSKLESSTKINFVN
jgi:mTERF domain-containing protein, mitochondrial